MKRRKMLLSMMLTAGLIVGMLPATALAAEVEAGEPTEIVVQAEEEASEPTEIAVQAEGLHGHPLCGSKCPDGQHNGTIFGQTLNSSNGTLTIAGKEATQDADGKYELSAGEYYLADNVDLNKGITIQGNVQICLNNKQIRLSDKGAVFTVNDNGNELTLTDCGENGAVSHLASYLGSGVAVNNGAAFNMYGGEISNNASANGVRMIKGSFKVLICTAAELPIIQILHLEVACMHMRALSICMAVKSAAIVWKMQTTILMEEAVCGLKTEHFV